MNLKQVLAAALFAALLNACSPSASNSNSAALESRFNAEITRPGLLLVDFNATWCGPCKAMKPIVEKAEHDYAGKIRILSVDVDQQPEIAQRYSIRSIPDFVLFKDSKVLDNRVGAMPEADFRKWLDGFVAAAN